MKLYEHVPHPHIERRREEGPVKVSDQHARGNPVTRLNAWLAVKVTKIVGSMWCAYAFAAFDMISLPAAIRGGSSSIVSWVAQTFLQLVLLSIILVGQDVQAKASDARAEQTYEDADAVLHTALAIEEHLQKQDTLLKRIVGDEQE